MEGRGDESYNNGAQQRHPPPPRLPPPPTLPIAMWPFLFVAWEKGFIEAGSQRIAEIGGGKKACVKMLSIDSAFRVVRNEKGLSSRQPIASLSPGRNKEREGGISAGSQFYEEG